MYAFITNSLTCIVTLLFFDDLCSHYKANISNDKAELYEKIVSVKLLVIVIKVFKRYPSTYCIMQGSCFICCDF